MSNRLVIEPTEFKNVRSGETTLGVRIYDDYGQQYINTWDSIPNDDMEVLKEVIKGEWGSEIETMLYNVRENELGIFIADSWYDWDEIKDLFEDRYR